MLTVIVSRTKCSVSLQFLFQFSLYIFTACCGLCEDPWRTDQNKKLSKNKLFEHGCFLFHKVNVKYKTLSCNDSDDDSGLFLY